MALANEAGQIQAFEIGNGGESDHKAVMPILKHIPKKVWVTLDKGFDSKKLRRQIRYKQASPLCPRRQFGIMPVRRTPKPFIYRTRWMMEQAFSRTDQFKTLLTRQERNVYHYKQYWYLGLSWLEIKKLTG